MTVPLRDMNERVIARELFSDNTTQELDTMDDLLNYLPSYLNQKIHIKDCNIWYITKNEPDGHEGVRMCWVPMRRNSQKERI